LKTTKNKHELFSPIQGYSSPKKVIPSGLARRQSRALLYFSLSPIQPNKGENYEDSSANCDLDRFVFDRIVISTSPTATTGDASNRPKSCAGPNVDAGREVAIEIRVG
jgi:hypothetical protein